MNKHTKRNAKIREILCAAFPQCFCAKGEIKKPLKLGIFHDVLVHMPEIGMRRLEVALVDYTGGKKYLTQIVEGSPRFDLQGNPAGMVTADEAANALLRLEEYARYEAGRKQ